MAAPATKASPFDWIKHHKRFLTIEATAIGASTFEYIAVLHCRRGIIDNCYEKYGPGIAGVWLDAGLSTVILPSIAEAYWHDNPDSKVSYIFVSVMPAYQVGQGIAQYKNYTPRPFRSKPCHFDKDKDGFYCEDPESK